MKRDDTNLVVAIAAVVTSIVAVFIAWDESRMLRRSQAASFMPIVETRATFSTAPGDLSITFEIRNTGHGVAFVEDAALYFDGEPITDYRDFSRLVLNEEIGRAADLSWAAMRGYLQAGETKDVITLEWEDTEELRDAVGSFVRHEVAAKQDGFELSLCYCSVFGDCWQRAEIDSSKPQPVDACRRERDPSEALWTSYVSTRDTEQTR